MLRKQDKTFCCIICRQRPQIYLSMKNLHMTPKNEASCESFLAHGIRCKSWTFTYSVCFRCSGDVRKYVHTYNPKPIA